MKGEVKLGILGGGQLGRMLMQSGLDFNIYTLVLDPDENAPCKHICNEFFVGSFRDFDTVYNFGKNCDILTIEIEHVNADALEKLEQEGIKVYPDAQTVRTIQDKGLQKEFYKKHNIPTSDFILLKDKAELKDNMDFLPAFQKLRREGYDGRGVTRLTGAEDTAKAFEEPSVLEKLVDFEKEISVIVARNESGEVTAFPVVELSFHPEHNLVDSLFAPANVPYKLQRLAIEIATRVIESFNMVGILAVEMFLTKDGQILVNEVAPRPHNSGHHTIKANYTSQYEQHLRAILNLPLGSTEIQSAAVMLNLLGESGYDGEAKYEGLQEALAVPGVYIHLYGKKYTRPARKMGHITVLGKDLEEAQQRADQVKDVIKVKA
ncbi:5-(carboxyamino)imidazole ribonucleotide synthase [Pontibacter aydingkolensis]|uniref:N5-carboxyaminoimidazole ribonucleotide synthase n=1 Tax=Pontibacter aydingkolensis TaxID=1911536 RepID=A0ABS7CYN3_9BACT|nr:5-(carboxyamino)imidazole ribonucleotide synthase [Pontibacter aydingkolensis]MBW7468954.1 5-(carboxyamino)imidazole ribonucleotide synthase [Pontibacter aydingkolensis]